MGIVNIFLFDENLEDFEKRVAAVKLVQFWVDLLSVAETQVLEGWLVAGASTLIELLLSEDWFCQEEVAFYLLLLHFELRRVELGQVTKLIVEETDGLCNLSQIIRATRRDMLVLRHDGIEEEEELDEVYDWTGVFVFIV